jgi:hypothetical protein
MVGQRAVVVRVAGSRPRGVLVRPAERAGRPATGGVSPRLVVLVPVVLVPVVLVKARGLAAIVLRAPPRDPRRGRRGFREQRLRTGRGDRAARLPPKDLARPPALVARLRVTSRAAARPRAVVAMVKVHAGRRVRRTPARREQVRRTAGRARAGTPRAPAPMTMLGKAAGGPRPAARSVARAGPPLRVSSAAVRGPRRAAEPGRPTGPPRAAPRVAPLGHRQVALPVTGPGLRGRTGPGRRATRTASVTVVGPQIATSGVMTAVRLRARVPVDRTAATVPQRATGRVAPAAGMAPHLTTAASGRTTAA